MVFKVPQKLFLGPILHNKYSFHLLSFIDYNDLVNYSDANTLHICGSNINEVISLNKGSNTFFNFFTDFLLKVILTNGS